MCPVQQSRGAGCPGSGPHSALPQTLMKSQPTTLYPSSPKTLSTLVPWAQGSGQQQALVLEQRRSRFSALPPVLGWPDTSAPGGPLTHRLAPFIGLTN